jgi:hypothetical protein
MPKGLNEKLMKSTNYRISIYSQIKLILLTVVTTLVPFSFVSLIFTLKTNLSPSILTKDTAVIGDIPFYAGLFSNIGVLLWCTSVVICLFSYIILKQDAKVNKVASFLLLSGLLTFLLLLDDFFLLHESFFPIYFGIKSHVTFTIYIALVLSLFIRYIKIIKKTEFFILLSSIAFFSLSIISDVLTDNNILNISLVLEDMFKLLGITCWLTYFARICLQEISNMISGSLDKDKL